MKKITLVMTLLLMAVVVLGQSIVQKRSKDIIQSKESVEKVREISLIWQNDFSIPSEWVTDYDSDNTNDGPWVVGTNLPIGYYSETMGAINSTTAANGFAMYDSDGIGNDEGGAQDSKLIFFTSINCAAYDAVAISFESYYRCYHGMCYVEVSADSSNWTQYQVHQDVEVLSYTSNPEFVTVNISAVAANQATVYLRFRYIGELDYAWMIDDIKFFVAPDHDLKLVDARVDFFQYPQFSDSTTHSMAENFGYSGFFGKIPKRQMASDDATIVFTGVVKNLGSMEANPIVAINVMDPLNTEIFSDEVASDTVLDTEENDTIGIINNELIIIDPLLGTYKWVFKVFENDIVEDNLDDNTIMYETEITGNMYSHNSGNVTGKWSTENYYGGSSDGDIVGVVYPFFNPDTIVSAKVYISSMTSLNTSFVVKLMTEVDEIWTELSASAIIMISDSSDIGNLHEIPFPEVVPIDPIGGLLEVMVAVEYYPGESANDFFFGMDATVPTSGHETFMYIISDEKWYNYGGDAVPVIDLELSHDVDLGSAGLTEFLNFNLYPNPTTGIFSVENVEHATIDVFNILGNCVAFVNDAQYNTTIDLSTFAEGTYVVRVTSDQVVKIRKVNLVK